MSLPPLPDIFGNYTLGEFNEIVSPPPVDWLPQTAAWYVVGAVLLAFIARGIWLRLRHWYRNRYRREAIRRLQALDGADNIAVEVNRLLKLAAMAAFTRQDVARLSGTEWTEFLNMQCPAPAFDASDCQLLAVGVYQTKAVDPASGEQLLRASMEWVASHKNRYDD